MSTSKKKVFKKSKKVKKKLRIENKNGHKRIKTKPNKNTQRDTANIKLQAKPHSLTRSTPDNIKLIIDKEYSNTNKKQKILIVNLDK